MIGSRNQLSLLLAGPALLAVVQQQLLLRLPPRLDRLEPAEASTGPAALRARFSRPMDLDSLGREAGLQPDLPHRWLGEGDTVVLSLDAGRQLQQPLRLELAGRDRRGLALPRGRWQWDPRPRILAVVPVDGGEQLQVREHDGRWRPISPVWPSIPLVEPLGDGSGVGVVSSGEDGAQRAWRIPLRQRNLVPAGETLAPTSAATPQPLGDGGKVFVHLSGNRRGELLQQSGGAGPGELATRLWPPAGRPRRLELEASGPMRLLPGGGAVVVPGLDGLSLHHLPPRPPRRETLPGSRDLSSFCPRAGRALLVRHWPDYRRSLELVEPGQAPRQLWIGPQALVASACAGGGERIWALLLEGVGRPQLTLLALDRSGRELGRRVLEGWELEPGTGLHHDPASDRLLAALRPIAPPDRPPAPARPVLIDARRLTPSAPLPLPVRQAVWLPAG
jgi:hypothetical protein